MAKKDDKTPAYAVFLIGLVLLIESVVFAFVLSQIPGVLLGATATFAWVYAAIKFFAGILAMHVGITAIQKK